MHAAHGAPFIGVRPELSCHTSRRWLVRHGLATRTSRPQPRLRRRKREGASRAWVRRTTERRGRAINQQATCDGGHATALQAAGCRLGEVSRGFPDKFLKNILTLSSGPGNFVHGQI